MYNYFLQLKSEVLVCGPTGSGKSSLVASFTDKQVAIGDQPDGVTKLIRRKYQLHDLPGFGDLDISIDKLIQMWNNQLSNKKVVVLLVLNSMVRRIDQCTDYMMKLINKVIKDNNRNIQSGIVLVFTHFDKLLEHEYYELYKYVQKVEDLFLKRYSFKPKNKIFVSNKLQFKDNLKDKLYYAVQNAQPITSCLIIKPPPVQSTACLSLNNQVMVQQNGKLKNKRLRDLHPGEMIQSWNQEQKRTEISQVVTMIHYETAIRTEFLKVFLQNGYQITLTRFHMIKNHRGYIQACQLKINQVIQTIHGYHRILQIKSIIEYGFCAPLTRSGNLIVNGIITSCYAKSSHLLGNIFSWPIRKLSKATARGQGFHQYFKTLYWIGRKLKIVD